MERDPRDMSDEELEVAFQNAKAEASNNAEQIDSVVDDVDEVDTVDTGEVDDTEEVATTDTEESDDEEEDDEASGDDEGTEGDEDGEEAVDEAADKQTATDTAPAATVPEVMKVKANGREFEFTKDEIIQQFPKVFGQAMDYTRKMQALAPWRKTIDAMEHAELKHEDINLMISAFKGDKGAIAEVLKRSNVDVLDVNPEENKYEPKEYGRDETTLAFNDVIASIQTDPEFEVTKRVLSAEWDDASWQTLRSDPRKVTQLHIDVKNGTYQKLQPIADKLKVFDGARKSDIEYYADAAREYYSREAATQASLRDADRVNAQREAEARETARLAELDKKAKARERTQALNKERKAAAPSAPGVTKAGKVDYLSGSDEDFDEWYKRLQEKL